MTKKQTTILYPNLVLRVKAVIADTLVIMLFMTSATLLFNLIGEVEDNYRMAAFLFIFVIYDPLFTSFFGGTIGHMVNGICVKRNSNQNRNLLLPVALIRFLAKATLGWISLLTVSGNSEKKAIHDFVSGSVVLYKK